MENGEIPAPSPRLRTGPRENGEIHLGQVERENVGTPATGSDTCGGGVTQRDQEKSEENVGIHTAWGGDHDTGGDHAAITTPAAIMTPAAAGLDVKELHACRAKEP